MDNRRSSVAQAGVDLVTNNADDEESEDEEEEENNETAEHHKKVHKSAANISPTAVEGSRRLNDKSQSEKMKRKEVKTLPKNMFACSLDATWKLHIVALPR
jgi:hypothetical protein